MNNKTKLLIRDAFFSSILSGVLILILALLFFNIRFFNPFHKAFADFSFLDVFYAERFYDESKVNADIVLINVPSERDEIARLLDRILGEDPKVVGVDVIFKDKRIGVIDSMLGSVLSNKKVVTALDIQEDGVIKNHEVFGTHDNSGYVNFNFDEKTSVLREFEGKTTFDDKTYLSFASQVAKVYLGDKWNQYDYDQKLLMSHTIKYQGYYDHFQYLDPEDFEDYQKKEVLKDKIVLLGYLGTQPDCEGDFEDKHFTPLNSIYTGKSIPDMHGVTVHANILAMLINNDFKTTISNTWLLIITFLCMFFSTMFYMKINKKYKISFRTRKRIFQFVVSIVILALTFWLFKKDVVIKPTLIIVGIILAGSYFKYYKHLTRYLKSKTQKKWKTYLK